MAEAEKVAEEKMKSLAIENEERGSKLADLEKMLSDQEALMKG